MTTINTNNNKIQPVGHIDPINNKMLPVFLGGKIALSDNQKSKNFPTLNI